jgi:hypothetical protein
VSEEDYSTKDPEPEASGHDEQQAEDDSGKEAEHDADRAGEQEAEEDPDEFIRTVALPTLLCGPTCALVFAQQQGTQSLE